MNRRHALGALASAAALPALAAYDPKPEPALAAVLGEGARVSLFRRKFIQPAASGKFALLKPLAR